MCCGTVAVGNILGDLEGETFKVFMFIFIQGHIGDGMEVLWEKVRLWSLFWASMLLGIYLSLS